MQKSSERFHDLLLIEDDAEFAQTLKIRLVREMKPLVNITIMDNFQKGLHAIAKNSFDLILLDINLPDSKGIQTYSKLRTFTKDIPVVILTGWDDNQVALDAIRMGAEDYIVKNEIDGKIIPRMLHQAMERSRIKKELERVTGELRETNLRLEKMTILDPLTELHNRRGLQQALTREIQWSTRHNLPLTSMILDLDHFKHVNDTFGYAVGDILLREVAGILRQSLRLTDHIARLGGDEFIALLPETDYAEGMKIAERIRLSIASHTFLITKKEKVQVTASVGIIMVPNQTICIDELLTRIHPYLKQSKDSGRNKISCEESIARNGYDPNLGISNIIATIRDENEFSAIKQPIFELSAQNVVGYEFLSRIKKNDFNFHMPDDFFRVALENNLLTLVDRHCFTTCIKAAQFIPDGIRCHINLFPSTLIDVPVQNLIESLPPQNGNQKYCFEISEQQIIGDPGYLADAVETLKKSDILIAIDDVGFGHSCLESLITFEPDIIKLSQKCVNSTYRDPKRRRSLERILKSVEGLGAEVVAEGIECIEELHTLQELGVKYGQGFLLGRPS